MAFNGTGTFVRLYNWVTDKTNSVPITASRTDSEMDGFATGLSNCITKDGQTVLTSNIPMASHKLTGLSVGSARTDSISVGQVQDGQFTALGTTGGAADAYTASPSPAITAYVATMQYSAKINATNLTTTPYLQVSSIATPASTAVIKKYNSAGAEIAVEAGDLLSGKIYHFDRNPTNDSWIVVNPEKPYINSANFVNNNFNPNIVVNGQGLLSSNGTSYTSSTFPANSDNTLLLDGMRLLSDGDNAASVTQETTTVPTGAYSAIKFTQVTASKQWAYVQHFNANDSAAIIGGTASLSFSARKGGSNATVGKLRAAILSWSGTVDAQTTDVVATWAGAGTNPSLATSWTYENTPSDLTLTTSYQIFSISGAAIDTASAKNVAVFIWLDDTNATVSDIAYITNIKLEKGATVTQFLPLPAFQERILVNRPGSEFISLATASSSASIAFTNLTSAYSVYEFEFIDILPATDGAGLIAQVSTDNGVNFLNSNYLGCTSNQSNNDSLQSQTMNTTRFSITPFDGDSNRGMSNAAAKGMRGIFTLYNPSNSSTNKMADSYISYTSNSGFSYTNKGESHGSYNGSTLAINAIRFKMSTSNADINNGNIASGSIILRGRR